MWNYLLTLIIFSTSGDGIDLIYKVKGKPRFYLNEPITFECVIPTLPSNPKIIMKDKTSGAVTSCTSNSYGNPWLAESELSNNLGLSRIDAGDCLNASQSNPFTLRVKGKVTEKLKGAAIFCDAQDIVAYVSRTPSTLDIEDIQVAPENLQLVIIGTSKLRIIENRQFTFKCTSSSASPKSTYKYEVITFNGNYSSSLKTDTYTPTIRDKDGITLKCTDTVHIFWPVREDIIRSERIIPSPPANTAAIVGGITAGLIAVCAIIAVTVYYCRRQ